MQTVKDFEDRWSDYAKVKLVEKYRVVVTLLAHKSYKDNPAGNICGRTCLRQDRQVNLILTGCMMPQPFSRTSSVQSIEGCEVMLAVSYGILNRAIPNNQLLATD